MVRADRADMQSVRAFRMGSVSHLERSLILITGAEGAGKSTVMSALLPQTPAGAKVDAEDVGQVNPFDFGPVFLRLLWANVTAVMINFWEAGYGTVISGSFLDGDTYSSFQEFRAHVPRDVRIYVVCLSANRPVRDQRRIDRAKPSSEDWRDQVDASYPAADTSLCDNAQDYRYVVIDNSLQKVADTVAAIKELIPEIYDQA